MPLLCYLLALWLCASGAQDVQTENKTLLNPHKTSTQDCQDLVGKEGCKWPKKTSVTISPESSCIFNCSYKVSDGLVRLNVHDKTNPFDANVFISVQQSDMISSWTLPIMFPGRGKNQPYTTIEEVICPTHNKTTDELYFRLSSTSNVTVKVSLTNHIPYKLCLNDNVTVVSSPVSPWFKLYEWAPGEESVLVTAESAKKEEESVCAFLSLQNAECPVGMNMESITCGRGRYQSFQAKGGMVARRSLFPKGIHIVVLPLPDDFACTGQEEDPAIRTSRTKSIRLQVLPHNTMSQKWGIYAVGSAILGVSLSICTFAINLCNKRNLDPKSSATSGDSENLLDAGGAPSGQSRRLRRAMGVVFGAPIPNQTYSEVENEDEIAPGETETETRREAPPASRHHVQDRLLTITNENLETSAGDFHIEETADNRLEYHSNSFPLSVSNVTQDENPRFVYWWKVLAEYENESVDSNSLPEIGFQRNMLTIAVFMALPFAEIIKSYMRVFLYHGAEDQCFYNSRCITSWGIFSDFSRIFTNIGYLLCGSGYLYILRLHKKMTMKISSAETLGVTRNYGLLESLGVGLIIQGFMSGLYHMCPNPVTIRFDMMFMYVNAVILIIGVWGFRHGSVTHHVYPSVGLVGVSLLAAEMREWVSPTSFWLTVAFMQLFLTITISIMLCKFGTWSFSPMSMVSIWKNWQPILQNVNSVLGDEYSRALKLWTIPRLILGVVANLALIGTGFGINIEPYLYILLVCIANMGLYIANYIFTKRLVHREKGTAISWSCLAFALLFWTAALSFFAQHNTNSEGTPSSSHALNSQCLFLVFDSHDLWHLLSAFAMFFTFVGVLTLDDDLARRNPRKIPVF